MAVELCGIHALSSARIYIFLHRERLDIRLQCHDVPPVDRFCVPVGVRLADSLFVVHRALGSHASRGSRPLAGNSEV